MWSNVLEAGIYEAAKQSFNLAPFSSLDLTKTKR